MCCLVPGLMVLDELHRGHIEVAPEKQTRELRTTLLPLELLWTAIAQRLVQALAVVKLFDVLHTLILFG